MNRRNQLRSLNGVQRAMVAHIRAEQPGVSRQLARLAFRIAAKQHLRDVA